MQKLELRKRDYPLWLLLQGLSRLPFPVLYFFSTLVYLLLYRVTGYRKKVVFRNLEKSFPEKQPEEIAAIAKQFYRNLADIIFEIIKLGSISQAEMGRRVRYKNPELIQKYLDQGLSLIALGSHACNWEWGMPSSALYFDHAVAGVYKPLHNPFFEQYMRFLRSRMGPHPVKMKEVLRYMISHRKEARMMCLLSDQTPPGGEIQYWTTFMNQDTPFYVGADKLADAFRYPVIFIAARRLGRGRYEFSFELLQEAGVTEKPAEFSITEAYARALEKWIRQYPADYLWSHRRWKHTRPAEGGC
jgi:Kdo2-lipid IVA lauroyltransferase/acyltransferase